MSAVARRYAKALFALAKERDALDETVTALTAVAAVAEDPGTGPVLRSPVLSPARRRALVEALARELRLSDLLRRFLGLLADHRRLAELPDIRRRLEGLLDDERGRVRMRVRSALPLAAAQQADLVARFAALTGKQVLPSVTVEAELLGGVVVEIQGKVYDGSVRAQLDRLSKTLAGTASF